MIYALFIAWVLLVIAAGLGLLLWRWALDRYADWLRKRKVAAIIERGKLRARNRETAKTLAYIRETDPDAFKRAGTFDALRADVTASDYGYRPEGEAWDEHVVGALTVAAEQDFALWEREAGA